MKTLRRHNFKNRDYFITIVTYKRQQILLNDIALFWHSWRIIKPSAWVILHDHFRVIINSGAIGISNLIHRFKITYSRNFRKIHGPGRIWQNRFWDHLIRDQVDLNRHLDYIHYNPVKHGLINDPFLYEHSSLAGYYKNEYYERDWGVREVLGFEGDYGE